MKVLVVEDYVRLAANLREALEAHSYAVDVAATGETARSLVHENDYDAAVLDWGIPPPTGLDLLRSWRGQGLDLPVLMLTGRASEGEIVRGLDGGADDYLTKPFSISELLARLRSLLRRAPVCVQPVLSAADVTLDPASHSVSVSSRSVRLSPKEFALLEYLMRHRDQVVSRAAIEEHVWDSAVDSLSNFVDVTVHRLRKKIDGRSEGALLHNVRGVGYILRSTRS